MLQKLDNISKGVEFNSPDGITNPRGYWHQCPSASLVASVQACLWQPVAESRLLAGHMAVGVCVAWYVFGS